jgi:8-oxo-dGTP diphosphatase
LPESSNRNTLRELIMPRVYTRRRGTAIVETEKGILVVAERNGLFLLPGGEARKRETRTQAAMRELREETGLQPDCAAFLFQHRGRVHQSRGHGYFRDHHTVCRVKARGIARPHREIEYVEYYKPDSRIRISGVTKEIIDRYYAHKRRGRAKRELVSIFNRIREWLAF